MLLILVWQTSLQRLLKLQLSLNGAQSFLRTHFTQSHFNTHCNPVLCSLFIFSVTVKVSQTNTRLTSSNLSARSWSSSALLARVMTWLWPSMLWKNISPFQPGFSVCVAWWSLGCHLEDCYHTTVIALSLRARDNLLFRLDSFCPIFSVQLTNYSSFLFAILSCLIFMARGLALSFDGDLEFASWPFHCG